MESYRKISIAFIFKCKDQYVSHKYQMASDSRTQRLTGTGVTIKAVDEWKGTTYERGVDIFHQIMSKCWSVGSWYQTNHLSSSSIQNPQGNLNILKDVPLKAVKLTSVSKQAWRWGSLTRNRATVLLWKLWNQHGLHKGVRLWDSLGKHLVLVLGNTFWSNNVTAFQSYLLYVLDRFQVGLTAHAQLHLQLVKAH